MLIDRRCVLSGALAGAAAMVSRPAFAGTYPDRPIHLVVPWAAGGGTDFYARLVGKKMEELIGQPILVENKPGAGSNLGADYVAKARPDGYTILLGADSTYAVNPVLYRKLPFDPEKDFAPISLTVRYLTVLLTNEKKISANSVADLVAAAKAAPGAINVAHVGLGSPFHLAAVRLQQMAGITLNEIPYKGAGPATQGLLSGDAHFMFVDYATARSNVEAGTLRALAIGAPNERPELPGVPPVARTAGLENFESEPWQGFVAPAKTPSAVIARLREVHSAAIADPVVRRKLAEVGAEPLESTPEEFTALQRHDSAKWAQVIRTANLQID
jgi:tripartite-type tricarboxylate transporter receptor subunit TctC